jgi:predicted metalloprotease with PDZ domain
VTPSGKTPLSSPLRLNLRSTPAQENVTQEWFFFNGRLGNSGEGCTFEISRNGYGSGFPYAENWNFTFPAKNTAEGVDVANIVDETMLVTPETDTEAGARSISQEERRTVLATLPNRVTVVLDSDKDGLEDRLEQELGTNPRLSDTDRDGLSDYDEHCKYRTDPTKKDSDSDGKPDGDWQERREYTYTIRAVCEIRPPSGLQVINDLYQDARPLDRKGSLEDAVVVELLLFPFATPHVYAQPYPKEPVDDALREYVRPTVSMNFSSEMKQHVGNIVEGADTDVQAIEKMLRWISTETELARYNPHWDYFHIVNDEIVWHGSLGDPEQDKRFLGTNFFADSMFKNKVHGTCSSTAILRGAMFRAAGLPTRLIQTLPLVTRYSEDPQPLADKLRMRAMANGYDWGPGTGGANHMYNEVFLNNRWVRVDNSIGTGPFVSDKLFVKAWSSTSLNNIKEEWNNKRCFRALDVSDAYPKYKSEVTRADVAIQNRDLTVKKLADGQYKATIIIHNNGQEPTPRLKVLFYAGDPDSGGRKVHPSYHRAGPIMPGATWGEATYPFILRESENEIFVVVDPDDAVQESDETNNKASTTINDTSEKAASGGLVDLAVADSDLRVSKLPDGRYFVSVTIHNRGSIVSPRFRIYHYSGDPDKAGKKLGRGYHNAGPIKPGETWKECGHFNLKPDDRQIFVVIDPDNTVRESDETNNKCFTEISSGPKKVGDLDIAVEDFKITFRDKYNAYYVVASIRNKGRDVSPQFPVHFYIGDPATAEPITHAAGPIKPGGVWNERSGNFGLRDGANLISVAVDPDNAFAESDETNNRASLSVLIEDGRIVKQSVSYSSAEAKERRPSPEHTEAVSPICPPAHQRHFVRLVVGPVTYRVTIPDDNWRIAKVNCQMATGGALSLWMNNNGAPRVPEGHGAFVRNLRAVDSAGNALVINDFGRGRWMIDGKDNQPVTLSYEVLLRHDESDLPWGPDEAPYVTEDGVFWTGRALFVVADMSDVTVRFNLPEGWRVSTPWGHRLNQESTFSLEDEEELTESFIFAGTHIEEQARVGDTEIVLVLGNALRGSREVIQNCLQELLRQYSELFGAAAPGRALVVVNAQDKKGSFDGGVFGSSVSMLMGDEPGRNNTGRWVPFVAHEVFHIWNGQALKHGGQEDWFSEGFTDYYAMVACARLNLISEEEFVRRLGRACEGYISISGNKPIRGAREHGLQYAGGSLVAACLDIQIRKLTDNTRNLDDLMRQMYEEFGRTGRQYCVEDVIRIANDIAGKDLGEFFKEYVEGTEELALEEAFADIGLELKKDVTEGLPARAYVIHKMLHIESLRHSGLLIRRSQEAGYRDEDRLRAIAGTPVESVRDIQTVAKRLNRGDKTEVVLLRDGKEVRMEITVGGEGKQVPLERKVEVEIEKEAELNASQKSILSGIIGS